MGSTRRGPSRSGLIAILVIALVASFLGVLAVQHRGYPAASVELGDDGVWVTDRDRGLVGHLNHTIDELDGAVRATAESFDVVQSGTDVLVVGRSDSSLQRVDTATLTLSEPVQTPPGADVSVGGGVLASYEPATGAVRIGTAAEPSAVGEGAEPVFEAGSDGRMIVGTDGAVHVLSPGRDRVDTIAADGTTHGFSITTAGSSTDLRLTAVGARPIVVDAAARTVIGDGWRAEIPGTGPVEVQLPSAAADTVVVATADELLRQPIGGGTPSVLAAVDGADRPAAPAVVGRCVHAAWTGEQPRYLRACGDDLDDLTDTVDGRPLVDPVFRVNRGAVALNDRAGGDVFVASKNVLLVDNWEDVIPPDADTDEQDRDSQRNQEQEFQERQEGNRPPIAEDDEFGVRPGRTTVLPVLVNDTDPDGDLLTAELVGEQPPGATVSQATGGLALQIAVPDGAGGELHFRYAADDGRGGRAEAGVLVRIRQPEDNDPPVARPTDTLTVAQGGSIDHNALAAWHDPDGDTLYAKSATTADPADEVQLLPNGRLTFTDSGRTTGEKTVAVTVSDGRAESTTDVRLRVVPPAEAMPVANPDHVAVRVGRTATVRPLANDLDPTGTELRLAKVADVPGLDVEPDFAQGVVAVTADEPGSHYLEYMVANGPGSATGIIRIDAEDVGDLDQPPTAADDVALLPAGGETLVDVLANDHDPAGGVLVVQSARAQTGGGVAVAVVDNNVLRIADESGVTEPTTVTYTVSNGRHSADGVVSVVPVAPPDKLHPPAAESDEAVVRVGDHVTIPVLRNDTHPDGDRISLVPELIQDVPGSDGTLFVSGDRLRFAAGDEPKTVHAIYAITDSAGQEDSAQVTIHILPRDDENNSAPRPQAVTAHVVAGTTVRIVVPTDGIDPDGDSVQLSGIDTAPEKGRIGTVSGSEIEYTALPGESGTDSFRYIVTDRLGMAAVGEVSVGIAPRAGANQAPTAIGDPVWVRPDRDLSIPVLENDTDPDGDALHVLADGLDGGEQMGAKVSGDRVELTAPHEAGVSTLTYAIEDARGAQADGPITVRVDPDAPLKAPVGRDDVVDPSEISGKDRVEVEVLANDYDPDGTVADLDLKVDHSDARVSGGTVSLPVRDENQVVHYSITDRDGLVGGAFVLVPGRTEIGPVLDEGARIRMRAGERVTIDLVDYVTTRPGTEPRITTEDRVRAPHADGSELVESATRLAFAPADGFHGETAISFEVTDGSGPDDPAGRKAALSLPITVEAADDTPPELSDGLITVAAGEQERLDVRSLIVDPTDAERTNIRFTLLDAAVPGAEATLDGTELTVSADAAAVRGDEGLIRLSADAGGESVETGVTVAITGSSRPLAVAGDDIVTDAAVGETVEVAVLANDSNPFPDTPLELLSAAIESGGGDAQVRGDTVAVTPSQVGTMVVAYRIADATGERERQVTGRIRLTVRAAPDAPSAPRVEEVRNATVVLTWTPPPNNGAPITHYTVESDQGFSQQCPTTTCTLTGLRNGTEYTFTVTATNEVGDSDPSPRSGPARPDAKPDTPQPPRLTDGDRSLEISWDAPSNEGTPIKSYTLELSPAGPGGTQITGLTGTSTTVNGLDNGVSYKARVQAINDAPDPSEFSPWSAAAVPAAVPDAPAAPDVARASSSVNGGVIDVSWKAPGTNGAEITSYDVLVFRGGSQVDSRTGLSATATDLQFTGLDQKSEYSFAVVATNRVGPSAQGARSAPVVPYGLPSAPGNVTATFGDGKATVKYSAADGNGAPITAYKVSGSNGAGATCSGTTCDVGGLQNGTNYTFTVIAVNAAGDGPKSSASAAGSPFGPPKAPSISGKPAGKSTTFTWDNNQNNYKNGRDISKVTVKFDNTAVSGNPGTVTMGDGYDQSHELTIEVCAVEGGCSTSKQTARSGPAPPRTVTIEAEGSGTYGSRYRIRVNHFPANSQVTCLERIDAKDASNGKDQVFTTYINTNGDGSGSTLSQVSSSYGAEYDAPGFSCGGVQATAR